MNITSTPATITHIVLIRPSGRASPIDALQVLDPIGKAAPGATSSAAWLRAEAQQRVPSSHPVSPLLGARRDICAPSAVAVEPIGGDGRRGRAERRLSRCRKFRRRRVVPAVETPGAQAWTGRDSAAPTSSSEPSMPISSCGRVAAELAASRRAPWRRSRRGTRRSAAGRGGRAAAAWRSTRRAKVSVSVSPEWPQPTWSGYSSSVYWQSWISRSASRARSKPEIHSGSRPVERRAERRLVVGDVGERGVAVGDPVAERRAAVGDRLGADRRPAELPLARGRVAEGDRAGQLADLDRRERGRDVAGDPVLERGLGRGRAPDRDLRLGPEAGREEHQPLDVVEVQVGEQDVDPRAAGAGRARACGSRCRRRGSAPRRSPGSPGRRRCCRRSGSSAAPAPGTEPRAPQTLSFTAARRSRPSGQKRIIAPEEPCSEATIGNALASIDVRVAARGADREAARARGARRGSPRWSPARRPRPGCRSLSNGPKACGPLLGLHPPGVLERAPEQRRGRLVVEDDRGVAVEQERRRRDAGQQVAGQDQLERLLRARVRHATSAFFHRLRAIATSDATGASGRRTDT